MSSIVITEAMLQPVTDAILGNVGVLLPVGLTIMGVLVGIGLVPKILYKFL